MVPDLALPESVPFGHDEDADGIADELDNCPAVANAAQTNSDTDDVGDACDPEPTLARQRLAFFTPFVGEDPRVTNFGTCSYGVDAWGCDGTDGTGNQVVQVSIEFGDVDVWTSIDIVSALQSGTPQLSLFMDSPVPRFYVELYQATMQPPKLNVTRFDGAYSAIAGTPVTDPIPAGLLTYHMHSWPSTGGISVEATLASVPFAASGMDPQLGPGTAIGINVFDVSAQLRSWMIVTTSP